MQVPEKKELKAIHMTDLSKLLESLNLLDDFNNEEIKCSICNDVITNSNIGSVKKLEDGILFTCNKVSCYDALVKSTSN